MLQRTEEVPGYGVFTAFPRRGQQNSILVTTFVYDVFLVGVGEDRARESGQMMILTCLPLFGSGSELRVGQLRA